MNSTRLKLPLMIAGFVVVLLPLAAAFTGTAAEPVSSLKPIVVTNYVVTTNVVLVTVTNYVVTTNAVVTTNIPAPGSGTVTRKKTKSKPPLPDLSWVPPADEFDWIQLKSGEWLRGTIKALQERKLEFDSEELKLLTFDWKDIRQLRSPRYNELLYGDKQKAAGPITITPDQVTVAGDEPITFPRSDLQSITPGGTRERYWSGKVSAGLTVRAGNTKSVDFNAQVNLQRRTPDTRFKLDYLGNLNSLDDVESADNHRVNTEFDLWLSRRLFLILPAFEFYKDPFQNIDRRFTVGGGLGYDIFARPNLEWSVTTGPAYQHTRFESVQAGEPPDRGTAAMTFGTLFDWQITRRIGFIFEYRGQYTDRDVGETFHHTVATLELDLTKRFEFDVSLVWDRIQSPQPESDGTIPKQDDLRLVLGLGVRF